MQLIIFILLTGQPDKKLTAAGCPTVVSVQREMNV